MVNRHSWNRRGVVDLHSSERLRRATRPRAEQTVVDGSKDTQDGRNGLTSNSLSPVSSCSRSKQTDTRVSLPGYRRGHRLDPRLDSPKSIRTGTGRPEEWPQTRSVRSHPLYQGLLPRDLSRLFLRPSQSVGCTGIESTQSERRSNYIDLCGG